MTTTTARPTRAGDGGAPAARLPRVLRGPGGQPAWVRSAALALMAATAVLYLWGLSANGWANSFYAAAAQAGTMDWKALLFGSLDPANSITVDKPPAALWVMGLSGRIFGFSSWSMLAPQALEGVASVGLLYAAVKRQAGPYAGLLAGAILALTPVSAVIFRFNNPDALLVLLMVLAAYAVVRGLPVGIADKANTVGRTWWFVLAGSAIGFAFLTKMLQAFLVVPGLALVVLVAAPGSWWRRIGRLLVAGAALIVSAGWYVALVELLPASARPYIGGSTDNSLLELTFGYNGLQRILGGGGSGFGGGHGGFPGGGGGPGGMFGGSPGLGRMFDSTFGSQISWLLPAALILLVAGLIVTYVRRPAAGTDPAAAARRPRTDPARAGLILWGGWLLVTMLVFSFMSGIIHPYYTVALAPGVGGVVAIGGRELWRRGTTGARAVLAVTSVVTGGWAYVLLGQADWHPELRYIAPGLTVLAAAGLLIPARLWKKAALTGLLVAIAGGLTAPAAYAFDSVATPQSGSIPVAGPSTGMGGFPGAGRMPGNGRMPGGGQMPGGGRRPGGQMPGQGRMPGGFGRGGSANATLTAALKKTTTTWAAATNGSQSAATLQLGSGKAIMAIGGFSGGDPSPTLAQFQQYVKNGKITYYVSGGMMGGPGGGRTGKNAGRHGRGMGFPGRSGTGTQIANWVQANFTQKTIGGTTVYDLTKPKG